MKRYRDSSIRVVPRVDERAAATAWSEKVR